MVEEQENPTPLRLADKRSISAEVGDAAAHAVNATGASATGVGRSAPSASEMGVDNAFHHFISAAAVDFDPASGSHDMLMK